MNEDDTKLDYLLERGRKDDAGKPDFTLVPPALIRAVEKVREYGVKTYDTPESWRYIDCPTERYHRALLRHMMAVWEDIHAVDPESGLPHLAHIACNCAFLLQIDEEEKEFMERYKEEEQLKQFCYNPTTNKTEEDENGTETV